MLRRFAWVTGALLLACASWAGPTQYSQRVTPIRAGVVIMDANHPLLGINGTNDNPFVWFNADMNRKVKPGGWTFVNPFPPSVVTSTIFNRWSSFGASDPIGTPITKHSAPYWEVSLANTSDANLGSYDVLLASAYNFLSLNPLEVERLRKFVDQGGVLWVDMSSAGQIDRVNPTPMPFDRINGAGFLTYAQQFHPLLSYPNTITLSNLNALDTDGNAIMRQIDLGSLNPCEATLGGDWSKINPIAGNAAGPALGVTRIGDGYIVADTRGFARALNRVQNGGGGYNANLGYTALDPTFDKVSDMAARFVVNMITLPSGYSEVGQSTHKTNHSRIDIGAPLLKRFDAPVVTTSDNFNFNPPVAYKGLLVVSTVNQVFVYDANPRADLDNDGNPDDGFQDFSIGSDHDLIWASTPMNGPISPPTCVEVPNAAGVPTDQVLVVDAGGTIHAFNALPTNANGQLLGQNPIAEAYTVGPPNGQPANFNLGANEHGPYAPTIEEGIAYVNDNQSTGVGGFVGRVWMFDPRTGQKLTTSQDWVAGGSSQPAIAEITASPTVGYVPIQDSSGGQDRVLYAPTRAIPGPSRDTSAGLISLWLGVRGEKPQYDAIGTVLTVTTRASVNGLSVYVPASPTSSLGIKLTFLHANGDPFTEAETAPILNGAPAENMGILTFNLNGGLPATVSSIRIDYTINWGITSGFGSQYTTQLTRGTLNFPDNIDKNRIVLNSLALSPKGTIFATVSSQTADATHSGGSLYALREEGRGTFRLLYRYDLYPTHQITLSQGSPTTYQETFFDNDFIQSAFNILSGRFVNLAFQGSPVVRGDTVYVTASAAKPKGFFSIPMTLLLAFRADPPPVEIHTGAIGNNFTIVQPDLDKSTDASNPDTFSSLQQNQFTYTQTRGSDYGTIRIDNLMSSNRGPIQNALSTSRPIIIRRTGQPDQLVQPEAVSPAGNWSPLAWYFVWHGVSSHAGALATGGTIFMAGSSALPSLVRTGSPFPTTGLLHGMDADIPPNDSFLIGTNGRPWQKQLWELKAGNPGLQANPHVRWPQASQNLRGFQDWYVSFSQTLLNTSTQAYGVVGGEGAVFGVGDAGITAFSRADFLVCDEGRVGRFDPAGNPIWSSDSTANTGALDVGATSTVKPLVRPTRAYRIGQNDMMVVDPGSNRIVRLDTTGRELRSIEAISLDPTDTNRPDGFEANEPLTFNCPRDVLFYSEYRANPAGFTNPQPLEYWVHYLIADSGNKRLVELIDRFQADPTTRAVGDAVAINGQRQLGVLFWQSPSMFSGKNFDYNSLSRVFVSGANPRWVFVAGIGSALPTRIDTGLDSPSNTALRESQVGNSGIVVFDGPNSQVINQVTLPAFGQNAFFDPATNSFNSNAQPSRVVPISNLTSVAAKNVIDPTFGAVTAVMYTDSTGVYEVIQQTPNSPWTVRWMLPNNAYRYMRRNPATNLPVMPDILNPADLRATYARRLDSGEVLIVDGYFGTMRDHTTPFEGEVIQVNGDTVPDLSTFEGFNPTRVNLGFNSFSVKFQLPPVSGTRGIRLPVFADRR